MYSTNIKQLSTEIRTPFLWRNGKILSWSEVSIDPGIHALHYGTGIFEGIRVFQNDSGVSKGFKTTEHYKRFSHSAASSGMNLDFTTDELCRATADIIEANQLQNAYLRPLCIQSDGYEQMASASGATTTFIMAFVLPDTINRQIPVQKATISPFIKPKQNAQLFKSKNTGHYILISAAARDAVSKGYNQAIFLDENQNVTEALTDNLFIVSNGVVITPPDEAPILLGITRETLYELLIQDGFEVLKKDISLSSLMEADEIFTSSTAGHIKAIGRVNNTIIGDMQRVGPITSRASRLLDKYISMEIGKD
ncbi:MAG: aminotransferase class IV [Rhizobiales bacterium]|nr:aminotransferase class IV [Hyphomicrobiales bacterium]